MCYLCRVAWIFMWILDCTFAKGAYKIGINNLVEIFFNTRITINNFEEQGGLQVSRMSVVKASLFQYGIFRIPFQRGRWLWRKVE